MSDYSTFQSFYSMFHLTFYWFFEIVIFTIAMLLRNLIKIAFFIHCENQLLFYTSHTQRIESNYIQESLLQNASQYRISFFSVATCTRIFVCISLSYSSLTSLINNTSVILMMRINAIFANFILMILSLLTSLFWINIVLYLFIFIRTFEIFIQRFATSLIFLKKRFLS